MILTLSFKIDHSGSLRTDSRVSIHPWSMEAPCNNLAVYQAGRWQQLVAIQHRTLPILLPPPRKNCSASVRPLSFSLHLTKLPLIPSFSSVSSCPPFLSLFLFLFGSPFHFLSFRAVTRVYPDLRPFTCSSVSKVAHLRLSFRLPRALHEAIGDVAAWHYYPESDYREPY